MAPKATSTEWNHEYNTSRREDLFRNPPTDHTAYPALQLAVNPHIDAFSAIFGSDSRHSLIAHAIADIGTKTFLDGDERTGPAGKNVLSIRYKEVTLQRAQLPPTNKYAKNRAIFPAECRERKATYRGQLIATFEYRINGGDPKEFVRELGQAPIMVKVRASPEPVQRPFLLI
jgi:DNA-directed RNA polymerase I subunit RPA2